MSRPVHQETERAVKELYRSDPDREWQRMERHRTEFAVTLRALEQYLPAPPAHLLDCGGGPGRYAIEMARRGYDVTLFDLTPELLAIARQKSSESSVELCGIHQGTATDLSRYPDAHFDAVLLMGPLYHLLDEPDRKQALAEAYRVAKPGGPVFAAFIGRYAGHIDAAANYPEEAARNPEEYYHIAATGLVPPRSDGKVAFTAYLAHPDEIEALCGSVGLEIVATLGAEGVAGGREEKLNTLTGDAWKFWVDLNYQIAHDPSTHGGAEHLLTVCRRPKWRVVLARLAGALAANAIEYWVVGGASLALRELPIAISDLDLEMSEMDAYRFQTLFAGNVVSPVRWRESENVRSHYGTFEFDGVSVDVMAGLERRIDDHWAPSMLTTHETLDLEGTQVHVLALEEEVLATIRRGRFDRAALALASCSPDRFLELLSGAARRGQI